MKLNSLALLIGFCLLSLIVQAEPAVIVTDEAVVFAQPDFESPEIAHLSTGDKVEVSKRKFPGAHKMGAFNRIKLANGKIGFISDAEFKTNKPVTTLEKPVVENSDETDETESKAKNGKKSKIRPFAVTKYRGFSIDYVGYKEQTMGIQPMANVVMYGFKMVGPNLLVEGDMVTELNVELLPGVPPFYQEATGHGVNGWMLHTDMLFESVFTSTPNIVTYAGFGPMFKYDNYNVLLTTNGKTNAYDLEDMIFGAVFEVGFGVRFGKTCLRTEFKYDWEKTQYWGLATSLLFQF